MGALHSIPFKRTSLYLAVCSAFILAPAISYIPKAHAESLLELQPNPFPGDAGGSNAANRDLNFYVKYSEGIEVADISKTENNAPSDPGYNNSRCIWLYSKNHGEKPPASARTPDVTVEGRGGTQELWSNPTNAATFINGAFISIGDMPVSELNKRSLQLFNDPNFANLNNDQQQTVRKSFYDTIQPDQDNLYPTDFTPDGSGVRYSNFHDNVTVNVNLKAETTFATKINGVRNDAGGASYNTVNVRLDEKDARLYAKLIFGGRSAQLEGKVAGGAYAGFDTDYNRVVINGGVADKKDANPLTGVWSGYSSGQTSTIISKGIFGAEGYQTNNNLDFHTEFVRRFYRQMLFEALKQVEAGL